MRSRLSPRRDANESGLRAAAPGSTCTWLSCTGPGFAKQRVHYLKHTYGRRLRAADVPEADRKVLIGNTDGSITSNYSAAALSKLIGHANKVSATDSRSPALTVLKRRAA